MKYLYQKKPCLNQKYGFSLKLQLIIPIIFFIPFSVVGQFIFPVISGPTTVAAGASPTINVNDFENTFFVPCGPYTAITITVEWAGNFDAFSREADVEINTGGNVLSINSPAVGGASDTFPTTLVFTGDFSSVYQPCFDGSLDVTLNQSHAGSSAIWSNITIEIYNNSIFTNDDCSTAISLNPIDAYCQSNAMATSSSQIASCFASGLHGDMWFSMVVPSHVEHLFVLTDSPSDELQFAVYSGTCSNLIEIQCMSFTDYFVVSAADMTAGETIYIQVDRPTSSTPVGTVCLETDLYPLPGCNDPNAVNYSPNATEDNGTCSYSLPIHAEGSIYMEELHSGAILKSPDGKCWMVTVDNTGTLVTTLINCP